MASSFIGVYARVDSAEALRIAREVYEVLEGLGVEARMELSMRPFIDGSYRFFDLRFELPPKAVVIGGDGTLLRFLCLVGERPSPVIHPIKTGRKGFFFELDAYQGVERLKDFIDGRYRVETLDRLRVEVVRSGAVEAAYSALNETAVVAPGSKTITLRITVDGQPVYEHIEGDGVIVATPAGSTAYSLSAGGPIVDRGLKAIVVTPVNPVSWARPVVVSGYSTVEVALLRASRPPSMYVDGQLYLKLRKGDSFRATISRFPALLARYGRTRRIALPW